MSAGDPLKAQQTTGEQTREVECDNCGRFWEDDEIIPLEDCEGLNERLDPGSVVPAGDCPNCGAFCYLSEAPDHA